MADTLPRPVYQEEAVLYKDAPMGRQSQRDPFAFPAHHLQCKLNSLTQSNYKAAVPR